MELFGIHEQALVAREKRTQLLAQNIANADTPNYKARDMDFASTLEGASDIMQTTLVRSNPLHMSAGLDPDASNIKYRIPMQNSIDGNTVDSQIEQAAFSENTVRYLASLNFINQRVSTILHSLKGE